MPTKSQVLSQGPRRHVASQLFLRLLIWLAGFLLFLTLVRAAACVFYTVPATAHLTDLFRAFVLGFRFDLSATCYILALPVLIAGPWLALGTLNSQRYLFGFLRVYFTVFSVIALFVSIVDLVYYSYFQDHINILVFGFFEDDTLALWLTFRKNYPVDVVLVGFIVISALMWYGFGRLFRVPLPSRWSRPSLRFLPLQLVAILLIGIGGRGTFALFPLGIADTAISSEPFVNYLSFSGLHGLHRAVKLRLRDKTVWNVNARTFGYPNMRTAAQDYLQLPEPPTGDDPLRWLETKTPRNAWAEKTRPHVVMLMMESFGSYWLRFDSPRFNVTGELKRHFSDDLLFLNFLPSMTATIGSLSALMINSPHRPEGGFLTESRYLQVPFRTAPARLYKKLGYKTRFIYGGAIGWRDIDKFARTQGFDSVEGDFEIESRLGRKIEKHDWGFYDEDIWHYLEMTLKEASTPELVIVMTTTNHPPYQLPSSYKPLPLEIPPELKPQLNVDMKLATSRFLAYQYGNQKLGEFMTRLKGSDLGDRTLVAASGDHGFLLKNFDDTELLHKWMVPLYLYLPKAVRPAKVDTKVFGSHADIFPTLYPLSLSETVVTGFGSNLLDASAPHAAFHFDRLAFDANGAVKSMNANTSHFYKWHEGTDVLAPTAPTKGLESLGKRYKALMSFLDEFYEFERKKGSVTDADSGR